MAPNIWRYRARKGAAAVETSLTWCVALAQYPAKPRDGRGGKIKWEMSAKWKTVRVFISSTFPYMYAEQEHLMRLWMEGC